MTTTLAKVKGLYSTTEAALPALMIAKQRGYSADTHRLAQMEADGVTVRYFWDTGALASQVTGSGTSVIGTPGIAGVTPSGGASGGSATLEAMLIGLKNYAAGVVGISGTIGKLSKFTAANAVGDSLLIESGPSIILPSATNGPLEFSIQNSTNGTSAVSSLSFYSGANGAGMHTAPAAYTDEAYAALRLNITTAGAMSGINIGARSTSQTVRTFFGATMISTTVFHTLSNKGVKQENLVLSTDVDATVAGQEMIVTVSKNDANTRQFYVHKILATLNTGGSNTTTTLDIMQVDTVNTATTGLSINLMNLKYGGTSKFKVSSAGLISGVNLGLSGLTDTFIPYQSSGALASSLLVYRAAKSQLGIAVTPDSALTVGMDDDLSAAITLVESTNTPAAPSVSAAARLYVRADKIIIQFDDAGTTRYKYLDLTGTGVTWVHSTSAP